MKSTPQSNHTTTPSDYLKQPVQYFFNPKTFARYFGREQTWTYRQIYKRELKSVKVAGRTYIPVTELYRLLGEAGLN